MWFQSPSLRGSGRFPHLPEVIRDEISCFNPLHCGAVVASHHAIQRQGARLRVSIPFIAGQWSLRKEQGNVPVSVSSVSIPFIAGQWSLPVMDNGIFCLFVLFQSPSLRGSGRFDRPPPHGGGAGRSFNPLHCGAVVASCADCAPPGRERWFQSPSLRGSGRFSYSLETNSLIVRMFQSPSLRGSGRFRSEARRREGPRQVSIPFIAGQWSLRGAVRRSEARRREFQSPSLRGSGRFARLGLRLGALLRFQSPSLRGSGRFLWSLITG